MCVLSKKGEPVAIGRLERFAADYETQAGRGAATGMPASTGHKVAVVGAGPAGLTVAGELARLGHDVTIFEALHKPGGVLVYGIPEFRLPKAIVQVECDYVMKLGVDFQDEPRCRTARNARRPSWRTGTAPCSWRRAPASPTSSASRERT